MVVKEGRWLLGWIGGYIRHASPRDSQQICGIQGARLNIEKATLASEAEETTLGVVSQSC